MTWRISIHASRVGGDRRSPCLHLLPPHFNPRLPGGRRPELPLHPSPGQYFNPRLPGGRRRSRISSRWSRTQFQSTPPGWEATYCSFVNSFAQIYFNPRLPGGRRRPEITPGAAGRTISIHASRVGGDRGDLISRAMYTPISIHASRVGGDRRDVRRGPHSPYFNPRLPGGRRPVLKLAAQYGHCISIHASRVGGD